MRRSGLAFSAAYERREAARFGGYKYEEFEGLGTYEQARVIAHYRCYSQMEAVIAKSQADEAQRNSHGK